MPGLGATQQIKGHVIAESWASSPGAAPASSGGCGLASCRHHRRCQRNGQGQMPGYRHAWRARSTCRERVRPLQRRLSGQHDRHTQDVLTGAQHFRGGDCDYCRLADAAAGPAGASRGRGRGQRIASQLQELQRGTPQKPVASMGPSSSLPAASDSALSLACSWRSKPWAQAAVAGNGKHALLPGQPSAAFPASAGHACAACSSSAHLAERNAVQKQHAENANKQTLRMQCCHVACR